MRNDQVLYKQTKNNRSNIYIYQYIRENFNYPPPLMDKSTISVVKTFGYRDLFTPPVQKFVHSYYAAGILVTMYKAMNADVLMKPVAV